MDEPEKDGANTSAPDDAHNLKALYDRYRQEFSAADLQKYTEIEEGIPLEQVIAEMERIHQEFQAKAN